MRLLYCAILHISSFSDFIWICFQEITINTFCKRWAPYSLTSLSPTWLFTVGTLAMPPLAGRAPKLFSLCLLFPVKSTTICLEGKLITPYQREDFGSVRHVQVDRLSPSKLPSHMDTGTGVALPGKSTISAVKKQTKEKLLWRDLTITSSQAGPGRFTFTAGSLLPCHLYYAESFQLSQPQLTPGWITN